MGSIPDVNFVGSINQMPAEESIGEMLSKLGSKNPKSSDQNNEIDFDYDYYSMGKEKQGKPNPIPLLVTKVADKQKEKERQKEKEKSTKGKGDKSKEKLKPAMRSGLVLTPPSASTPRVTGPTTRNSPRKANPAISPEGAPLLPNPNINPTTGLLRTSEAKKKVIEEILGKRKRRSPTKDLEEETNEEPPAKGRRTSRWLRSAHQEESVAAEGEDQGKVGCSLPQVW